MIDKTIRGTKNHPFDSRSLFAVGFCHRRKLCVLMLLTASYVTSSAQSYYLNLLLMVRVVLHMQTALFLFLGKSHNVQVTDGRKPAAFTYVCMEA